MEASDGKAHILVIEDEPMIQSLLKIQLEKLGYRVSVANEGQSGFKIAQESPPDLMLLDLMMPELDGFQVLKRVKAISRLARIPVVILTASHDDHHRRKSLSHLADAFLTKPYRPEELAATIQQLLGTRQGSPTRQS
jgi:DNA-binding response OmpR family regulator